MTVLSSAVKRQLTWLIGARILNECIHIDKISRKSTNFRRLHQSSALDTAFGETSLSEHQHPATLETIELLQHCEVRRVRRSGPGGQRRNKVETGIVLKHPATGLTAEASERRSAGENQHIALSRLRIKLAINVREAQTDSSTVSALWQSRCRGGRVAISPNHSDFPSMLAEAMDFVDFFEFDLKPVANKLNCTTSQLIKLLKLEPNCWALVNRRRREHGLIELK